MQNTKKIIVPEMFYKLFRKGLFVQDNVVKTKEQNPKHLFPFTDPNVLYMFEINKGKNRKLKDLHMTSNFCNGLNIKGNILLNIHDIQNFNWNLKLSEAPTFDHNFWTYSSADKIDCNKIIINNEDGSIDFSLSLEKATLAKPSKLSEVELIGNVINCEVENLPSIKKLIIKPLDLEKRHKINLKNLQNLELLDLSELEYLTSNNLILKNINPNCKIRFSPNFYIQYSITNPLCNSTLKEMLTRIDLDLKSDVITMDYLFPEQAKNKIIEVTYAQFKEKLLNFSAQEILNTYQQELREQQYLLREENHKLNLSKEKQKIK